MEKSALGFLLRWLLAGVLLGAGMMTGMLKGNGGLTADGIAVENIVADGIVAADETLDGMLLEQAAEDEILTRLRDSMPVSDINRKLIDISRIEGTEKDLLDLVYDEMEAWEDKEGCYIQGQINLSFEGLVLASVECGDEYRVFIALPEGIYRISFVHYYNRSEWSKLIRGTLDEVFEEQKVRRDLTEDFFRENMAKEEECSRLMVLWYRGIYCEFHPDLGQRLLSWQRWNDGFSFRESYHGSRGQTSSERTLRFRQLEDLGGTKSHSVMRKRLQEIYPDLETCYIWSYEKNEAFLAEVELPENESAGFYSTAAAWQRSVYQIFCTDWTGENERAGIERLLWDDAAQVNYFWTGDESAVLRESDEAQGYSVYRKDIGEGVPYTFSLQCAADHHKLSLYEDAEEGEQLLQELEFEKESKYGVMLSFDDLNGDGYEDLLLVGSYVEKCCLWSPSQKLYVDMSEELGPFRNYVPDEENRQLWVHRRGFNCLMRNLYQWSGELDCELLKEFYSEYTYTREGTKWEEIVITVRENGADKILSDYIYPYEDYSAKIDELWDIFYLDFVWEQKVTVNGEDNPCILRYAQEKTKEEDGAVLYTDRLFLFRGDTYLIGSYSGVVSSVPWEEISMDEKGRLSVTYEDGSSIVYSSEFYE